MEQVKCAVCGKLEMVYAARAKKYKTCSRSCMGKLASINLSGNVTGVCKVCGTTYKTKESHKGRRRTCSKSCFALLKSVDMAGEGNHQHGKRGAERGRVFKGGRRISSWGYVLILTKENRYEFEHRLVMEAHIGRKLEHGEHVHHINGDKQDNRLENLELMSKAEHTRHHNKARPMPRDNSTQRFIPRRAA